MMRLPAFELLRPRALDEACALLAEHEGHAAIVAGGTDLFPKLKRRQLSADVLVALHGIEELRQVHENGGLSLGSGVRLAELVEHPALVGARGALAHAAGMIASPQIRNVGTLGGNLCLDTRCDYYDRPEDWRSALGFCLKAGSHVCRLAPGGGRCWAVSTSDLAPVALALDGAVRLAGPDGERVIPLADLYRDDGAAHVTKRAADIIVSLELPSADGLRATYLKLRRRGSIDFPLLGVAAAVRLDGDGVCTEARLALGAVASQPFRVPEVEALLVGRPLDRAAIEEAATAAAGRAKPMDNMDLTPAYRKRMVHVFVARALQELADAGAAR